jgi:hypothetical protein
MLALDRLSSHRSFVFGTVLMTAATLGALELTFFDSTRVISHEHAGCNAMLPTEHTAVELVNENAIQLETLGIHARPFPTWQEALPCFPPDENWLDLKVAKSHTKQGFLFCKGKKVGSSTGSGITLRIATNVAQRLGIPDICSTRFHHTRASYMAYSQRDHKISSLPTQISKHFFKDPSLSTNNLTTFHSNKTKIKHMPLMMYYTTMISLE